jgi:pantoate--beta-alanine ligase
MRIVKSIGTMQRLAQRWRRMGQAIGLVPTMGSLHAGHLSLVHRARRAVGPKGQVVVSIYVNPTQFGPNEDFTKYPRPFARDVQLCRAAGADAVFAPGGAMYAAVPGAEHSTYVVEEELTRGMEGRSRPTHFRGVTTVVAKLFNIVRPDVAVFGQKDFQQAAVVRRMIRDLNFGVRLVVAPTVREPDGLAMSSRNQYLSAAERRQATVLWKAIQTARRAVRSSKGRLPVEKVRGELAKEIATCPAARVDYIAFFDPETLLPVERITPGTQLALAVQIGGTRLIDNARL